jgi:SMI1-KNR4 cell-wall
MDICQFLQKINQEQAGVHLKPVLPATLVQINKVEKELNCIFPSDLKRILLFTNGIREFLIHENKIETYIGDFIFSIEVILEIIKEQRECKILKEDCMPFENLLFFARTGTGDLFFHPIAANGEAKNTVFIWNAIGDDRNWVAADVFKFMKSWFDGSLVI